MHKVFYSCFLYESGTTCGREVFLRAFDKNKNPRKPKVYKDFYVVGVKRLELPTSSLRATCGAQNCLLAIRFAQF